MHDIDALTDVSHYRARPAIDCVVNLGRRLRALVILKTNPPYSKFFKPAAYRLDLRASFQILGLFECYESDRGTPFGKLGHRRHYERLPERLRSPPVDEIQHTGRARHH